MVKVTVTSIKANEHRGRLFPRLLYNLGNVICPGSAEYGYFVG